MESWCAPAVILLLAAPVAASDPMAAEVLFDGGTADMKAGRFAEGCPKIAESQRLEPRAGSLFTLAECWARAGRTATALARYHEYLRVFARMSDAEKHTQRGREGVARSQIEVLDAVVPRLRLELPDTPAGTVVKRNGVVVGAPSLGIWLPVDPGEQRLELLAPGRPASQQRLTIGPGEQRTVRLEVPPAPPAPPAPPLPGPKPSTVPDPKPSTALSVPADLPEAGVSRYAVAGWTLAGASLVGITLGSVTGAMVLDRKPMIERGCGLGPDGLGCTPDGKRVADEAQELATASTVSFIAAAALGGAAVALFVVDSTPLTTAVTTDGRLTIGGRW